MNRFNIRVYGVCINDQNELLVSNESYKDLSFTKFPGGGMEWGEGTKECLKREFLEEFGLDIEVGELFYLTDFFQRSAFIDTDQVISIYYRFTLNGQIDPANYVGDKNEELHWIPLSEVIESVFTFPIDKLVANMLFNGKSV